MEINKEFEIALKIVNESKQNLFLTGKAGSGKTTFLKYLVKNSYKNIVVAAPTGVAAINAQGVTLHSLFHLPFQMYVPSHNNVDRNMAVNRGELLKNIKFRKEKLELLNALDVLIIDEISMVRADMLDAIDEILRFVRRNPAAFGGVQVVFIGDMYQLPPILKNHEMPLHKEYYDSVYFFDAYVLRKNFPICVELQKIYRQSNQEFINILNNLRHQTLSDDDMYKLNERYISGFKTNEEGWVTLTTHNQTVYSINAEKLSQLPAHTYTFKAEIKGDFPENMYPLDENIELKEGAQVMFIKNDSAPEKNYFNGKLAKIISLNKENITVEFLENKDKYELKKEEWQNLEYTIDAESGGIKEKVLGSFLQYPIKLAWAITVHKSQGLTFDKVMIDISKAFAAGQVYVALSRCTSLAGIVFVSMFEKNAIALDERILNFHEKFEHTNDIIEEFEANKHQYAIDSVKVFLNFGIIFQGLKEWKDFILEKALFDEDGARMLIQQLEEKFIKLEKIKNDFISFLNYHENEIEENWNLISQKSEGAINYFYKSFCTEFLHPLQNHRVEMSVKSKAKTYIKLLNNIYDKWDLYLKKYINFYFLGKQICEEISLPKIEIDTNIEKKSTYEITFSLLEKNKTLQEISDERNMSLGTIETHIIKLLSQRKLKNIDDFISKSKFEILKDFFEKMGLNLSVTEVKRMVDDAITFFEIRLVQNYLILNKQ